MIADEEPFTLECTCGAVASPGAGMLETIPAGGRLRTDCPGCGRRVEVERDSHGRLRGSVGVGFRMACPEDIDALVAMGRAMMGEAPALQRFTFDDEVLRGSLTYATDRANDTRCGVIVGEDPSGRLVAVIVMGAPHGIAWRERTGHEDAFYVDPTWRKRGVAQALVLLFIEWCRARDCVRVTFGSHTGLPADALEEIALRLGCQEDEGRTWSKELAPMHEKQPGWDANGSPVP